MGANSHEGDNDVNTVSVSSHMSFWKSFLAVLLSEFVDVILNQSAGIPINERRRSGWFALGLQNVIRFLLQLGG